MEDLSQGFNVAKAARSRWKPAGSASRVFEFPWRLTAWCGGTRVTFTRLGSYYTYGSYGLAYAEHAATTSAGGFGVFIEQDAVP